MTASGKKPGVAFWATVVVAVLLLYVGSFVAAVWLVRASAMPIRPAAFTYRPLVTGIFRGPDWIMTCVTLNDPGAKVAVLQMLLVLDPIDPSSR
jgi:hypothetical protein